MRWTCLRHAAFEGNSDVAAFLIEKGADVNATTRDGRAPVDVAKNESVEMLFALKEVDDGAASAAAERPLKRKKTMPSYNMNPDALPRPSARDLWTCPRASARRAWQ